MRQRPVVLPLHYRPGRDDHHRGRKALLCDRHPDHRARRGRGIALHRDARESSDDQDDPHDPQPVTQTDGRGAARGSRCLIRSRRVHDFSSLAPDRARVKELDTYPPAGGAARQPTLRFCSLVRRAREHTAPGKTTAQCEPRGASDGP